MIFFQYLHMLTQSWQRWTSTSGIPECHIFADRPKAVVKTNTCQSWCWAYVSVPPCCLHALYLCQCFPAGEKESCCSNLRHQPSNFWPHSALLPDHMGGRRGGIDHIWSWIFSLWCRSDGQCWLHGVCSTGKVTTCLYICVCLYLLCV